MLGKQLFGEALSCKTQFLINSKNGWIRIWQREKRINYSKVENAAKLPKSSIWWKI